MVTIYISIGNSDNKLTQEEWADFIDEIDELLDVYHLVGRWFSAPDSEYQNACWCVTIPPTGGAHAFIRGALRGLAERYRQDSIVLAKAETEFVKPREKGKVQEEQPS